MFKNNKKTLIIIAITFLFSFAFIGIAEADGPAQKGKRTLGIFEKLTVLPGDFIMSAKIDTGAVSSSINSRDIEPFTKDGKDWVRFRVLSKDKKIDKVLELPILKIGQIKNRQKPGETKLTYTKRYYVEMELCLDGQTRLVSVNLADRRHFDYALLIGRDTIIAFDGVVDPSLKYNLTSQCKY